MDSPRSASIIARDKSIPALMPADVQMEPSFTKMQSGSKRTRGNFRAKSAARLQRGVARLPSGKPAPAKREEPEQPLVVPRAWPEQCRMNRRVLPQETP